MPNVSVRIFATFGERNAGRVGPGGYFYTSATVPAAQSLLLLIPCNVVDNRQIVDIIETEYFLQFQGNHSQRVGIVTLSGIKDTRYSVDIAEIQFIIFVFGTAQQSK